MTMRRLVMIAAIVVGVMIPVKVAAECAPYWSSTDPYNPASGYLVDSWCISWGPSLGLGFSMTICEDCTCWYRMDMGDGVYWTINNNQIYCKILDNPREPQHESNH